MALPPKHITSALPMTYNFLVLQDVDLKCSSFTPCPCNLAAPPARSYECPLHPRHNSTSLLSRQITMSSANVRVHGVLSNLIHRPVHHHSEQQEVVEFQLHLDLLTTVLPLSSMSFTTLTYFFATLNFPTQQ